MNEAKQLNIKYLRQFATKFNNETDALVTLWIRNYKQTAYIGYIRNGKDPVRMRILIRASNIAKYEVNIICEQADINIIIPTDNLNEVQQACDLLIYTAVKLGKPLKLDAKIKASHWGLKLVTVERQDGYRANLYVSNALRVLERAGIISINGATLKLCEKSFKTKVAYSKNVLNYDKIQKEGNWDKYSVGFKPIKQYPKGNDYMHPSITWQKNKLF